MINGCEMLTNVTTQYIAIIPTKLLCAINRTMRAFTNAIGIAVWDKYLFKAWLDNAAKRMMHHPVTESGGTDLAPFWLMNEEVCIWARSVAALHQFFT